MKQEKLVKILRLNIKDENMNHCFVMEHTDNMTLEQLKIMEDDKSKQKYKKLFQANKQFKKSQILTMESEVIRLVQAINKDNTVCDGEYPFVKDLIIVKFGRSAKRYKGLTDRKDEKDKGIITIQKAFQVDGDKKFSIRYKNLICSSSNVRCQKALFIREDLFDAVNKILLCGIPENYPFKVFAKYNSYYGLVSTDSIKVSMPTIVVIPDFKNIVTEVYDIVSGDVGKEITAKVGKKQKDKVIGHGEYNVNPNQTINYEILPFDGAGLVDVAKMKEWVEELGLEYIPAAVQFRAMPGIKGNLYTFDIKAYAEKLKAEGKSTIIIDYWGKAWDLLKDNINCIMTKSQFKFADIYKDLAKQAGAPNDGFNIWHDEFIESVKIGKDMKYQRTFNLSEISEPYSNLKNECVMAYQPLQTLKFETTEIMKLCEDTIDRVEKVHTNLDDFLRYRGLVDIDDEESSNNRIPPFYQALKLNPSLYYNNYIRNQIKDDLKSLKYRCYTGKLFLVGNYQVFSPDVYGLVQAAFRQPVTGLLQSKQIYSNYWNKHNTNEVDIIRSPHIACEHFVTDVANEQSDNYDLMTDWYRYQDTGIVTSMWDSMAMRLNSADYDGDHVMSVSSRQLIEAAKRANANTILFDRKDDPKENNELVPINNISKIIETSTIGMQNRIGDVVNDISILWSLPETEEIQNAIKIMSIIGSLTIDFAKSGEKAEVPPDIKKLLKGKKKPEWMKYRHKSDIRTDRVIKANCQVCGIVDDDLDEKLSFKYREDCTMQKICDYMKSQIGKIELQFDDITDKCMESDLYNLLMLKLVKGKVYTDSVRYVNIKQALKNLQDEYCIISNEVFYDSDDSKDQKEENGIKYQLFFEDCANQLLKVCTNVKDKDNNQVDTLLDYLIYIYYTEPDFINSNNAILWNAFSKQMINRCSGGMVNEYIDIERVNKKLEKNAKKIKSLKANSYLVHIKQFDNMKETEFTISNNEINQVKNVLNDINSQRLFLILLGLYRKNGKTQIKIGSFGKENINQNQICKLARFDKDARQYKKSFANLLKLEYIKIDTEKSMKQPTVVINDKFLSEDDGDQCKIFTDINDYAEIIEEFYQNPEKNE